ncbi:MAG: glycosyltransferase family 39 protein [Planctomycetia bacterium]|nr:glycosyltransferase family 39 protein [Planctomycetia bacterium]
MQSSVGKVGVPAAVAAEEEPQEAPSAGAPDSLPSASAYRRQFWFFAVLNGLLWGLVFAFCLKNCRLDTIEQYFVGQEWVFGSTKHPALTATLLDIVSRLTFRADFAHVLLTRLCVLVSLWAIWRAARELVSEGLALLAAVAMFNYWFFQYESINYNNNVTLNMAWSCTFLFTLLAYKTNRMRYWLLAGVTTGAGLYFKYTMILMPIVTVLFMLVDRDARKLWRRPGPWVTTGTALLIFLPLALWVARNDYVTLGYATRHATSNSWSGYLLCPLRFLVDQLPFFLPIILPLIPVCGWLGKWDSSRVGRTLESRFLLFMLLGPLLLQLLISSMDRAWLRGALGCHLWLFFTILLLHVLKVDESRRNLRRGLFCSFAITLVFMMGAVAGTEAGPWLKHRASRYHFPGKALAIEVEKRWHAEHADRLPWVAGSWWHAGNVSAYGEDRARVHADVSPNGFFDAGRTISTWSTTSNVNREGGMIVWLIPDDAGNDYCPPNLKELFPKVILQEPLELPCQTRAPVPAVRVGIGLLEPETLTEPAKTPGP